MNIFVSKDGKRIGPFSLEQIKSEVLSQRISLSDLAWAEGEAQWKQLAKFPSVIDLVVPACPDLNPNETPSTETAQNPSHSGHQNTTVTKPKPKFSAPQSATQKTNAFWVWLGIAVLIALCWLYSKFTDNDGLTSAQHEQVRKWVKEHPRGEPFPQ